MQETIFEHDVAKEANIKFSQMYLKPLARTNIVLSKSAMLLEYQKIVRKRFWYSFVGCFTEGNVFVADKEFLSYLSKVVIREARNKFILNIFY